MKKALVVFLAMALVGSAAFAEISPAFSIGSWGRALWNVAGGSDDGVVTDLHQSWGGNAPRTAVNVRGDSDNVSYALDIFSNGNSISVGDNAYIEIRPFSPDTSVQAALTVGKTDINEARGDAVYGLYNWDRIGTLMAKGFDQQGFIFDDMLDVGGGASLRLYPIDGLTIGVAVPLLYDYGDKDLSGDSGWDSDEPWIWNKMSSTKIAEAWLNASFYVSYDINNVGKIKVGYAGQGYADTAAERNPWGKIGVSFDLTAVENLVVSIGGKIPTRFYDVNDSALGNVGDSVEVNAHVSYNLAPFTFNVLFGSKIMELDYNKESDSAFGFTVGAGITWEVVDSVPVFVDVRYANGVYMAQDSASREDCFTVGAGVSKLWANCELGVAFECATNGYGRYYDHYTTSGISDKFVWAIPIKFEYSF